MAHQLIRERVFQSPDSLVAGGRVLGGKEFCTEKVARLLDGDAKPKPITRRGER